MPRLSISTWITYISVSLFISAAAFAAESSVYVQIKSSKVRSEPKIWASAIASVSYGDALEPIEESNGWVKVKTKKGVGYIPSSSLSTKKVILASNASVNSAYADQTDAILAGKGFDANVERSFAATSKADFRSVDAMERIKVSDADLRSFVTAGSLGGGK